MTPTLDTADLAHLRTELSNIGERAYSDGRYMEYGTLKAAAALLESIELGARQLAQEKAEASGEIPKKKRPGRPPKSAGAAESNHVGEGA